MTMTQKKFIKRLMADGFSRNEANKIMTRCRESGFSYEWYYKHECQWVRAFATIRKLGGSFKNVSKAVNLANSTMMSFAEAMYEVASKESFVDYSIESNANGL